MSEVFKTRVLTRFFLLKVWICVFNSQRLFYSKKNGIKPNLKLSVQKYLFVV